MGRIERSPNLLRVLDSVNRRVSTLEQSAGQSKTVTFQPSDVTGLTTTDKTVLTVDLLAGQDAILEVYVKATGTLTRTSGSANIDLRVAIDGNQVFPSSINGAVLIWNSAGTTTLRTQHGTAFGVATRSGGFIVIEQDSGVVLDAGLHTVEFTTVLTATGSTASLTNPIISLRCS